jgi:hypothetical protein
MIAVGAVPASRRPYVDGSHHNSIFEQVFVYNGFGRFGQLTPRQLLAGQSVGIDLAAPAPAGPGRLFHGDLGRDIGWLLPLAIVAAGWGIVSRRRQGPSDPPRACFVLWGGWLVTLAATFSFATSINSYYTAALMFAAALAGGVVAGSVAPAVASTEIVAAHQGAFDTPFEPTREADSVDAMFIQTPKKVVPTIPGLEAEQRGAPDLLATQTAAVASVFIDASGREALPIGGFSDTIPAPTLSEVEDDVRAGRFHVVLAGTSTDPRITWIAAHCHHVGKANTELHIYYCQPGDAS